VKKMTIDVRTHAVMCDACNYPSSAKNLVGMSKKQAVNLVGCVCAYVYLVI
jgi:hypothetical protein